jgi:hypothetical protein
MSAIIDSDLTVRGTLVPSTLVMPNNSITNSSQFLAGLNLDADKTEQRVYPSHAQPNTAATSETRAIYVARRSGTLNEVIAGSIAKAVGDSTVTVDVKKNGTTVLTGVITLDSGNTNRVVESGAIAGAATFVVGDWFEVVITAVAGTGTLPTGVFAQLELDQNGA